MIKLSFKSRRKPGTPPPVGSEPPLPVQIQRNPPGYVWRSRRKPIASPPRHTFDFKAEKHPA